MRVCHGVQSTNPPSPEDYPCLPSLADFRIDRNSRTSLLLPVFVKIYASTPPPPTCSEPQLAYGKFQILDRNLRRLFLIVRSQSGNSLSDTSPAQIPDRFPPSHIFSRSSLLPPASPASTHKYSDRSAGGFFPA